MFEIQNTTTHGIRDTAEDRATMVALQAVGQYLVGAGLELGKDFSFGRGGLILNESALTHLQQKLGPDHFNHIMAMAPSLLQLRGD